MERKQIHMKLSLNNDQMGLFVAFFFKDIGQLCISLLLFVCIKVLCQFLEPLAHFNL